MGADPFLSARTKMVEGQLVPGNILDERLVAAFSQLPRELFVSDALKGAAYVDEDIEVAHGRYLMAPLLLARMLGVANVSEQDSVLDIGCASGYSSAVLSMLAARVVAVEERMELAEKARQLLTRLHRHNAEVITGPLLLGYPGAGPYDVIFIGGAVETVPETLIGQLAEGGRLVTVRRLAPTSGAIAGLGRVVLAVKSGGKLFEREVFDASIPLLPGFEQKKDFVF